MKKNAALYNLTQSLQGAVFQAAFKQYVANMSDEEKAARPKPHPLMQLRGGLAESPAWVMVQVMEFAPEPLTVEKFRRRAVYSAPNLTLALLEMLASAQFLDSADGAYWLTESGQAVCERMTQNRIVSFVDFYPIAANNIAELATLMKQVIIASTQADISTWSIDHSRNRAPDSDVAALAHIVQYGSDFNAFRDDAHMAAYGEYDVLGHVWEGFMTIATGSANHAGDLYQQLAYRGFYTADWQVALDDLCERGWLAQSNGTYTVTEAGQRVRDAVEAKTDKYFYSPWNILSDDAFERMVQLMQTLQSACNDLLNS